MCRFVFYLGSEITLDTLVTRPKHSIIHQSYHSKEREEPLNGDGFGVAWYVPELSREPGLFRSVSPAWSNANLRHLARVTKSGCILAHIRAATPGLPVTELNCHPFVRGPLAFMHNGNLGGFRHIKRTLQQALSQEAFDGLQGSTDSEHIFALFWDHYRREKKQAPVEKLAGAMAATFAQLESMQAAGGITEPSFLNLVVTDGSAAAVTRYVSDPNLAANSLYVHSGRTYTCENGICHMVDPKDGAGSVLIASEPLSRDAGWDPIGTNQMALVTPSGAVLTRPIDSRATSS